MDEQEKKMTDVPVLSTSESTTTDRDASASAIAADQATAEPQSAVSTTETKPEPASTVIASVDAVKSAAAPLQAKSKKPLLFVIIGLAVVIAAVVVWSMLRITKADYQEALDNVKDGRLAFDRQYSKAFSMARSSQSRPSQSDRRSLEELTEKNRNALQELSKLKALVRDKQAKQHIAAVQEATQQLEKQQQLIYETAYDVAPVLLEFSKIQALSYDRQRMAKKLDQQIEAMRQLKPQAEFNKKYLEELIDGFGKMAEILHKLDDQASANAEDRAEVLRMQRKIKDASDDWQKTVNREIDLKNRTAEKFRELEKYLKAKVE